MKKNYLKKVYRYDNEKNQFIIEISLDYYLELFNAWDAATIKKKDLDPELVSYLDEVSEDIPLKEKIAIVFVMPENVKNEETELISKSVFINHFFFLIHLYKRDLGKLLKQSIYYLITGFVFLLSTYFVQNTQNLTMNILSQGLFIGGWVFIWEATSIIFFKSSSIRRQIKRYLRFTNSEIIYEYK